MIDLDDAEDDYVPLEEKKMAAGRTLEYQILRICERFGQSPFFADVLERQDLNKLLAYERIREREEMEQMFIGRKGT